MRTHKYREKQHGRERDIQIEGYRRDRVTEAER